MDTTPRRLFATCAALLCAALSACADTGGSELTVEGSFTGSEESECVLSLRDATAGKFVDSATVKSEFREAFSVESNQKSYFAQVNCPDDKWGRSPDFEFHPPRSGIKLQQITVD